MKNGEKEGLHVLMCDLKGLNIGVDKIWDKIVTYQHNKPYIWGKACPCHR